MSRRVPFLVAVLFFSAITNVLSATKFAKEGGATTGSCDSWANACTLERALVHCGTSDEIHVQAGTYKPTTPSGRTATFALKDGCDLLGGYNVSGNQDERVPAVCTDGDTNDKIDYTGKPCKDSWISLENPGDCGPNGICSGNKTILTGDLGAGVYSYHVVTYGFPTNLLTNDEILDGFIIEQGHADGTTGIDNQGAAIQIRRSSPKYCYMVDGIGENYDGLDCTTSDSICGTIGAGDLGCKPELCLEGGPIIKNCLIQDNVASDHGAVNDHGTATSYDNCSFIDNNAPQGAGLLVESGGPSVTNCLFVGNTTSADPHEGAGAWFGCGNTFDRCSSTSCSPTVENSVFYHNEAGTATSHGSGAGLFASESGVALTGCTFQSNYVFGALFSGDVPLGGGAGSLDSGF